MKAASAFSFLVARRIVAVRAPCAGRVDGVEVVWSFADISIGDLSRYMNGSRESSMLFSLQWPAPTSLPVALGAMMSVGAGRVSIFGLFSTFRWYGRGKQP